MNETLVWIARVLWFVSTVACFVSIPLGDVVDARKRMQWNIVWAFFCVLILFSGVLALVGEGKILPLRD